MTRRLIAGLIVGALVALPLACGDDDVSSDSTEAAASDATEGDDTDETEAPDDTGANDTTADDSEADAPDEEVTGGDLARWCELSAELDDTAELDDAEDPAAIEAAYGEVEERADEYVDAAPDQIRDDAETVVGSLRELRDLLESHGWDVNEVADDPAFVEIFTSDVEEAGNRLDDFEDANCS